MRCLFGSAKVQRGDAAGLSTTVCKIPLSVSASSSRVYDDVARKWHVYSIKDGVGETGKTHIIWGEGGQHIASTKADTDEEFVRDDANAQDAESNTTDMQSETNEQGASGIGSDTDTKDSVSQPTPYVIGSYVEYYSWSNRKWLLGVFQGAHRHERGFIVDIIRGQRRFNVRLDCLRSPLLDGELVEVFSKSKGWLPGVVNGHQDPRKAVRLGYDVKAAGRSLQNIPPERLRRRFPCGLCVEVWQGPSIGWVSATVHPDWATSDGCGTKPFLDSETPCLITRLPSQDSESSMTLERLITRLPSQELRSSEQAEREHPCTEPMLEPWVSVPIFEGDASNLNSTWMAPSYSLRESPRKVYVI